MSVDELTDYNPYLGRTVENSAQMAAQAEIEKKQERDNNELRSMKANQEERPATSGEDSPT